MIREIHGLALTLDVPSTREAFLTWHHRPLAALLGPGETVRIHRPQCLLEVGSSWLSIVHSEA